ncbi:MAG: hypothetical protein EZS28_046029 [Streblomastix strix]|uniref:Uncharacterized protein n=1 Tax=Streblomastix strix TaxID=222440 RepID=A0A5J4TJ66_9EUKA|nr:MAG: hypothetical protein EZS28_046029 [Streblomastix strix]
MRPVEIEGISLRHSVISKKTDKVDLQLQPKTRLNFTHTNFQRLEIKQDNKFGALQQIEGITIPAKRGQNSLRLKKLLDEISINQKQIYSFRRSATEQLVVMGLDETLYNTDTGYAWNSKSSNIYYVFAQILKDNEIATNLFNTRGQVE